MSSLNHKVGLQKKKKKNYKNPPTIHMVYSSLISLLTAEFYMQQNYSQNELNSTSAVSCKLQ